MQPLNPYLYSRLVALYTDVRIAKPGEAVGRVEKIDDLRTQRPKLRVYGGEEYVVRCDFCGDTSRHGHLYVHYRYGTEFDELGGQPYYRLANCVRRNCLLDPEYRRIFRNNVVGNFVSDRKKLAMARLRPGQAPPGEPDKLVPIPPPGTILTLSQLSVDHRAIRYLEGRGYDCEELERVWGVGLCAESSNPTMEGRIYAPIHMNGELVAWQGRYPADLDWKSCGTPKYYNPRGMPKRLLLYGYDVAREYPAVVLCEGVADVWRVGPAAVALLGKTLSAAQADLVVNNWGKGVIIILLDSNDPDAPAAAGRIENQLRNRITGRLLNLRLPDGLDPGLVPRDALWSWIATEARTEGVELPVDPIAFANVY